MKYIKTHPTKYTHFLLISDGLLTASIIAAIIVDFFDLPVLNFVIYTFGVIVLLITVVLLILDWLTRK